MESVTLDAPRVATLGPSEALRLATLDRKGARHDDLVRAAFADAVLRDVLRMAVVRTPTMILGDRVEATVMRGAASPDVMEGPERAVADAVLDLIEDGAMATIQSVGRRLQGAFGDSLTGYRDGWVDPSLTARGLMEIREGRFLLLLKVRDNVLTDVGRSLSDRLSTAVDAARAAPESFASEALAREIGAGAFFAVPGMRAHAPHLSCLMTGRPECECRGSGPLTADMLHCIETWITWDDGAP